MFLVSISTFHRPIPVHLRIEQIENIYIYIYSVRTLKFLSFSLLIRNNIFKYHSISFLSQYTDACIHSDSTIISNCTIASFLIFFTYTYIHTHTHAHAHFASRTITQLSRKLSQREEFQEGLRRNRYMERRLIDVRQFLLKRWILIRDAGVAQRSPEQATAIAA